MGDTCCCGSSCKKCGKPVAKINIGTEIRQAYEQALAKTNNNVKAGQAAVTEKVKELIIDGYGIKGSASLLQI